jgi:hypothetical protein
MVQIEFKNLENIIGKELENFDFQNVGSCCSNISEEFILYFSDGLKIKIYLNSNNNITVEGI